MLNFIVPYGLGAASMWLIGSPQGRDLLLTGGKLLVDKFVFTSDPIGKTLKAAFTGNSEEAKDDIGKDVS